MEIYFIFGICQNTLYLGLNFLAMDQIDAYLAVIVASLLPIFVAIISFILKKNKIYFLSIIGILIGFLGCSIILVPKITVNFNLYGYLIMFNCSDCISDGHFNY